MTDNIKVVIGANADKAMVALKNVRNSVKNVASSINGALGALGLGLGLASASNYVKNLNDSMDNLAKTARAVGTSGGELQAIQDTYQHAGIAADQAAAHLTRLNMELEKSYIGSKESADKFARLGISWRDLQTMSPADRLGRVIQAMQDMTDKTDAAAAASALLGDSGARLLNIMQPLADSIQDFKNSGRMFDEEQLAAAESFNDSIQDIQTSIRAMVSNSGLIDWLAKVVEGIDAIINKTALKNANKNGFFSREQAIKQSIDDAEKSGKYTPEQIKKMKAAAVNYETIGGESWIGSAGKLYYNAATKGIKEQYDLVDQVLRENGFGDASRDEKGNLSSAPVFMKRLTDEERKKQLEELAAKKAAEKAAAEQRIADQERLRKQAAERKAAEQMTGIKGNLDRSMEGIQQEAARSAMDPREAYIQSKIDSMKKSYDAAAVQAAKLPGVTQEMLNSVTWTQDIENKVRSAAAATYDNQHADESAAKAARDAIMPVIGNPDLRNAASYSYARMGATLAGTNSNQNDVRANVKSMKDSLTRIASTMPTRSDIEQTL